MTPDEAKTKACCGPPAIAAATLRYCIADACMAWRWGKPGETELEAARRYMEDGTATLAEARAYVKTNPEYRRQSDGSGYCGLAGQP